MRGSGRRSRGPGAALAPALLMALAAAQPARAVPPASVTSRAAIMAELGKEFARDLARLRGLAADRAEYFRRGLGWRSAEGHGFQTRTLQAYFSSSYIGFTSFDSEGREQSKFGVSYKDRIPWAIYSRSDGHKVTAGYGGAEVTNLEVTFPDGSTIGSWGPSLRVAYPGGGIAYSLSYQRGEPIPNLSPDAASALRGGNRVLLDNLKADLPNTYLVRVLADASAAGVALAEDRALGRYAIRWFSSLGGAPEPTWSEALEKAASSHAQYIVSNAVVGRLSGLSASSGDADVFLGLHSEESGYPGFTGKSIADRTAAAGYGRATTETANFGWLEPVSDIASWFTSLFHRRPFVDPRVKHVGYARAVSPDRPTDSAGIANWGSAPDSPLRGWPPTEGSAPDSPLRGWPPTEGSDWSAGRRGYLVVPRDGERLVPFAWAAMEAPNPLPGRADGTGSPISVAFSDRRYRGGSLELLDPTGSAVPLLSTSAYPDPEHFVEAIPASPLRPGTTYSLRFSYGGTVDQTTFTTAPLNPAETVLSDLKATLAGDVELRALAFDVEAAVRLAAEKGELVLVDSDSGARVEDRKYGFSVRLPTGWSLVDRTWQELALRGGNATVSFTLYGLGPGADAEDVVAALARNMQYRLESTEPFATPHVSGVRREYSWQYAGRVILYCLIFGDLGLGVYGYGVTPELMAELVESLEPT